jgi:hypothetical protein
MRRIIVASGMSLLLAMSVGTAASAGVGHAYGLRIKACTNLSYGQLLTAIQAGQANVAAYASLIGTVNPAMGAKRTWTAIQGLCAVQAQATPPGLAKGNGPPA